MLAGYKLLVVSAFHAPSAMVGAKRFSFLVREFETLGAQVDVLAMPHSSAMDETLPKRGTVHHVRPMLAVPLTPQGLFRKVQRRLMTRVLGVVDPNITWLGPARRMGGRLIESKGCNLIIATTPISTSLLVGASLSRKYRIPLVIDYRDPWTGYPWVSYKREKRRGHQVGRRLEFHCLQCSVARVFVTRWMRSYLQEAFPTIDSRHNYVISNGFDPVQEFQELPWPEDTFKIVHAGVLYGDRSILPLLKALAEMKVEAIIPSRGVRVQVYGLISPRFQQEAEREGLANLIEICPRLPRKEMLKIMAGANLLLAVSGREMLYSIPYKVFDYLAISRPMLALGPKESALSEFVQALPLAEFADFEDKNAIRNALQALLTRFTRGTNRPMVGFEDFEWARLARNYAELVKRYGTAP
jgi:glycosyltransferase involved in cell wall biosynthesis